MKNNLMECGAGVTLAKAYVFAREKSLSCFECGATIPATIGGATYMNASAFDFEMSKIIDYVVAYHNRKITYLRTSDCNFGYRESVFQNGEYIILRVGFKLTIDSQDSIIDRHNKCLQKRLDSQPINYPNAGCIFKRIENINVSKLLDEMGAKDYAIGGAKVSEKHVNFIVNYDHATSSDIKKLIEKIKKEFYLNYQIDLIEEIKYLGDFNETNR
jgi:UDP-N-acetylmuramate dehydrogenase